MALTVCVVGMVLRGGELDGVRCLSQCAVSEMTRLQTSSIPGVHYGLGWQLDDQSGAGFGHGGAMGTELWLHPGHERVTVLLVHQDGGVDADGGALRQAVRSWGIAAVRTAAL